MERWQGKVAIVTGASAGIGASIVEKLVGKGVQVVGLARRLDRLQELSKKLLDQPGRFHAFQADITKEEDILSAFKWTTDNLGPVQILINNAGVARPTTLIDGSTEEYRKVFDTNVLGLTIATREAVKIMMKNDVEGHIIHVNSVAGHYINNIPLMNVYPASKFAVTALADTLRIELLNAGNKKIKITSLSPGFVESEIVAANGFLENELIAKIVEVAPRLYPEDISIAVLYVLGTPPHVQISELTIRPMGA